MTVAALPTPKNVRDLLTELLDREVTVGTGIPVAATKARPAAVAVFVDDELRTLAVSLLDLPLCGAIGGAIGLLPVDVVNQMVEDEKLSEILLENLYEVANVLSVLFNAADVPHVTLHKLYAPREPLPSDLRVFASSLGFRLDLEVAVAGYGDGRLSIVALARRRPAHPC